MLCTVAARATCGLSCSVTVQAGRVRVSRGSWTALQADVSVVDDEPKVVVASGATISVAPASQDQDNYGIVTHECEMVVEESRVNGIRSQ